MTSAEPATEEGLRKLHEVLHPLGQRQVLALAELHPGAPRETLMALQAGVVAGVRALLESKASAKVRRWVLLADDGIAGDYLNWLTGPEDLVVTARDRFVAAAALGPTWTRIGAAYESVFPGDLRHRLGEHYTPVPLVAEAATVVSSRTAVVLDPACGDGRFLGHLLVGGHDPSALHGTDLNPLAVLTSRLQIWLTSGCPPEVPPVSVRWGDFLLAGRVGPTADWPTEASDVAPDFVVGNPPWVLWRTLGDDYRKAIAAAFASTKLNQASGWGARVAVGQTDLAHLFVHEALERVAPGGGLALVLPRSVFKGPIGASVIRTGRLESGRSFAYQRVVDYQQDAFPEVRQETVVAFARVDTPQVYPVRWEAPVTGHVTTSYVSPSDPEDPSSPWSERAQRQLLRLAAGQVRWRLKARGGVNTGGGNGIFHVRVIEAGAEVSRIENRPARGLPSRVVQGWAENHLTRPLLAGRDVACWRAAPTASIVFPHDPADFRKPLREQDLVTRAPRAYAFLSEFRPELASRKELARWGGEWYSLFRVGPYTADCWRVVWPSSSARSIRAAVLAKSDRTIPDQKVVLVRFETPEPAYYLCALLNSSLVRDYIADGHGIDASPSLTERLALPAWDENDPTQVKVMELAREACRVGTANQSELDELVGRLYVANP